MEISLRRDDYSIYRIRQKGEISLHLQSAPPNIFSN